MSVIARPAFFLGLCVALLAMTAQAAAPAEMAGKKRPRIALVLSGGGARGLAHIGVVKALQKMHVPYDCIVGTSMGAIAGGALASGLSVDEAQQRVESADWNYMFSDGPKRSDIPYFRKQDDWKGYFDFSLLLKDGKLYTPRNFLGVQHIDLFFRELTGAQYSSNFDALPIPYRAMGTDIVNGESVPITDGTVATAMRASMGVPGVFPPVPYKGHLLVDGGIAKNIPIDTARQLCGDVVIVVNVSTPTLREEQLNSFYNIGQQVISIAMQHNMDEQLHLLDPKKDVLITPKFGRYTAADFAAVHDIIQLGQEAAEAAAPELQKYALSAVDYAAWQGAIDARKPAPPYIRRVTVGATQWVNHDVMRTLLDVPLGQPLDIEQLHRNIARVYSRGDFDSISYDLKPMSDGGDELLIKPVEKAGRDTVRLGLQLETDSNDVSDFELLASWRKVWLNKLDAEWNNELALGTNQRLRSEWFQPLATDGVVFVAPYANFENSFHELVQDDAAQSQYQVRKYGGGVELGSALGRWGQLRVGAYAGQAGDHVTLGVNPGGASENRSGYTLHAVYDQIDDPQFPHSGSAVTLKGFFADTGLGASENWNRLDVDARTAFTSGLDTILLDGHMGRSLHTELPFYELFHLGGLFNLSAYRPWTFYGNNLVYGRMQLYRQLSTLPSVIGQGLYGGVMLEGGTVLDNAQMSDMQLGSLHYSGGVYFAVDSRLGPFYLAAAKADGGPYAVYLALGVNF
jgi:NTE family protein